MAGRSISDSTFLLTANGAGDAPPGSAVRDYLLRSGARKVTTLVHPLGPEEQGRHELTVFDGAGRGRCRTIDLPSRPPYTYPVDLAVPPLPPRADVCLAFNNLLCMQALGLRRLGRVTTVGYWAVDFVPDRFGAGPLTQLYDRVDRHCCLAADARIEVSRAALEGRNERHALDPQTTAPTAIAPIGAWLDRTPQAPEDAWRRRRVVFIGHLVERMGVNEMIEALGLLESRGVDFSADVIGRGPLEAGLRRLVRERGLDQRVRFPGYISDHRELERMVAEGSIAVAPYSTRVESFTRFADPSKLKTYLAAGLPILLTDVPPNAAELAREGGAEIVDDSPAALAAALERLLGDPEEWRRRRAAAVSHAHRFDWSSIVGGALGVLGFSPPVP